MDQRSYTALSTRELVDELENRAERVPIDMTSLEVSTRIMSRVLGSDTNSIDERELRSVAIGYLLMLDALSEDMARKVPPRAEDGDVVFCNRSWVPGKRFDELREALANAGRQAQRQRADARNRAGLGDLAAHDHRRDTRDELETQTENEALS